MNALIHRSILTFLLGILMATACGPFFPDSVLDLPQAALRVRGTCTLDEIVSIDRAAGRGLTYRPAAEAMIQRSKNDPACDGQMSYDEDKLYAFRKALKPVIAAGMPEEVALAVFPEEGAIRSEAVELAVILLEQKVGTACVAGIVSAFSQWRKSLPCVSLDGAWDMPVPGKVQVSLPPVFPEVPADIAAYWKAAQAWRGGDLESARRQWREILNLPENDRKNRAVWAAWMLAKTSPDAESAVPFYHQAISLAENGCLDSLGLAALAMGWIAITETDPVIRLKWYFEATCLGNEEMLISLRKQIDPILTDPAAMQRAAKDPLAREIVTALYFMMSSEPDSPSAWEDPLGDAWLDLLEEDASGKPSSAAAKAAWICYDRANFHAARRWLAHAPADAGEVLWLQAKLALRDGKMDDAAKCFAKAAPAYDFEANEFPAPPSLMDTFWHDAGQRRDWMKGQFHSDRAIVHIGRGEFIRAMDFLAKASYDSDASYLAERVLTTDELVAWVKKNRPGPEPDSGEQRFTIRKDDSIASPDHGWDSDRYRYLLARRLAREFRFREAAEFMPRALQLLFDHYVRLHRASLERSMSNENRALILWHMAHLRRHLGMEMFGYEGAPDLTSYDGLFGGTDYMALRSRVTGWSVSWEDDYRIDGPKQPSDFAIPAISREEIRRIAPHLSEHEARFHYRYDAAEIAWRAACLLPDNDPRTLFILHEAGRWLAPRDPQAANRYYLEMMRRCKALPEWQELDRRRWFLPQAPVHSMPELPVHLRPSSS
ncbi:MAG: hypothetical protein RL346_1234 [Verrucomicrobiota bacterium]